MKPRFVFLTIGLVAVLLASCAPQATQLPTLAPTTVTQLPEIATQPQVTDEPPTVIAVATSRGPDLEATDPTTVSLASGQLQLVEFFRFT
ncbi:MAG: hypothetical protein HZB50_08295 [Chloroflexi bacterium]|nr:hypothetical protein [Chloroflexota bacterium]